MEELAVLLLRFFTLVLHIPPHFFGLAQRNGVEPQRKTLLGWWRPREVSGPTRLSHSRGRCHSAAKVSASRTDWITRPRGEGLGLDVDWRLKVFCPAFLQKSGRGPGAEPWPRAAARGILLCSQSAGGGQRGNPRRGFPLLRPHKRAQFPSRSCATKNEGPVIGSLALHWRKLTQRPRPSWRRRPSGSLPRLRRP